MYGVLSSNFRRKTRGNLTRNQSTNLIVAGCWANENWECRPIYERVDVCHARLSLHRIAHAINTRNFGCDPCNFLNNHRYYHLWLTNYPARKQLVTNNWLGRNWITMFSCNPFVPFKTWSLVDSHDLHISILFTRLQVEKRLQSDLCERTIMEIKASRTSQ